MKGKGSIDLRSIVKAIQDSDIIITPRVHDYLLKHGDDAYPRWVVERIADLLSTQPRIRSGTFSASSAGQCPRAQVLGFLGPQAQPTDPQLQNIFNDGKWRHLRWQALLLAAGLLIDVEFGLTWPKYYGVGTMDGLGVVPDDHEKVDWRGEEFGFELKGVSTFLFAELAKKGPKEEHLEQVHRYFAMSGLRLFVILYEDKTTQAIKEWVIEADPVRLARQKKELATLRRSVDARQLPPMLPECAKRKGDAWNDCQFGGNGNTCVLAKQWPSPRTPGFTESHDILRKFSR